MTEPTWVSDCGTVQLYLGDCLEVLPTLEAGSVDAVVADPPYGIGFDRATWADDRALYPEMMRAVVAQCNRIAIGVKAFWQALLTAPAWHTWFPEEFRVFAACKGFVQFRPTPVQWNWDPIVWWGDPRTEPSVYAKDWYVQALAPFGAHRKRIEHPSPKPIETTAYVVSLFTRSGDIVLDPFMGSGTTGVACVQTGRKFIGIEIDPGYFEIAKKRIQDALAQPRLEGLT